METQESWNKDKITLLNMQWTPDFIMEDKRRHVVAPAQSFNVAVEEPKIIVPPQPDPIKEPPPVKNKVIIDSQTNDLLEKHKTMFHCLPVYRERNYDSTYDMETFYDKYGDKFLFAGVIVTETDLQLVFWTDRQLTLKTIVYPKNFSKRCWRIESIEPKSGGYMYSALTSDINPDFSD